MNPFYRWSSFNRCYVLDVDKVKNVMLAIFICLMWQKVKAIWKRIRQRFCKHRLKVLEGSLFSFGEDVDRHYCADCGKEFDR